MSTVIKDHEFAYFPERAQKARSKFLPAAPLKQIVFGWAAAQSSLHNHWRKFSGMSNGQHVSYRAWSRHGAYLEINTRRAGTD